MGCRKKLESLKYMPNTSRLLKIASRKKFSRYEKKLEISKILSTYKMFKMNFLLPAAAL